MRQIAASHLLAIPIALEVCLLPRRRNPPRTLPDLSTRRVCTVDTQHQSVLACFNLLPLTAHILAYGSAYIWKAASGLPHMRSRRGLRPLVHVNLVSFNGWSWRYCSGTDVIERQQLPKIWARYQVTETFGRFEGCSVQKPL